MNKKNQLIDWMIFLPIVGLMFFSVAFVYSASSFYSGIHFKNPEYLFISHTLRIILGLLTIIVFAKIDYHVWQKLSKPLMIIGLLLLIFVLVGGSTMKGATRWISLGPISFQPSEFAKFALVIHFANLLSQKQGFIKDFERGFLPFILWTGLVCLLIALQPNFSTMIVIFMIAVAMMFIGNTNLIHLLMTFGFGFVIAVIYALSAEYRLNRFKSFLGMSVDADMHQTINHQLNQALIAIGNGGIFGVGAGQTRQSNLFLPESYGDFIFSIIGEEYGFIGLILILLAFGIVFWRGMLVAKKAPDNFGYFLAIGILITFAVYVFVNAGVNTGLLPTTGVPMPFVSYGGTAILFYAAAIGILLNISAQSGIYPNRREDVPNVAPSFDDDTQN